MQAGLSRNDGKGDAGLHRAATGILGGLFQTPLYHLHPVGVSINDGGGRSQTFVRHDKGAVGMATNSFPPPSSFQRRLESRRGGRGMQGWQGLSDARVQLSLLLSFPHRGNGWSKPLDSGLRRNDGG